jgi:acyl transferase domain-containing protein
MHVPDEANIGPGESVAIIGAALRFPGASDPSSFHEITVAGRRMFRERAHRTDNGGLPEHRASPHCLTTRPRGSAVTTH